MLTDSTKGPTRPRRSTGSTGLIVTALLAGALCAGVSNYVQVDQKVWAIVLVCAAISSVVGFAFSALAGPLLVYVAQDQLHAIQIMLVASIALQAFSVWRLRHGIEVKGLVPYLAGGVVTIPLGIYLLVHTPTAIYAAALGAFLIAYASYMLIRPAFQLKGDSLLGRIIMGALGGVTGATAAFPGAFVTIWCGAQGWDKERQRAVYQPYILCMQILTLLALAAVRPWQRPALDVVQCGLPAMLGAYVGLQVFGKLTTAQSNAVIGSYLLLAGAALTAKVVWG